MTKRLAHALAAFALVAMAGCSSDNGPSASDLVGTWSATSFVFTSQANPGTTEDAIAAGASLTVTFASGGTYTTTTSVPGSADDVSTGTYTVSGSTITLNDSDGVTVTSGTFTVSGSTLTLHLTTGITFDFGSGEEAATADATLHKQ